ncbi:hypothetical protein OKC_05284 [Enterococcus faecium EnGen0044]|nr:hypothetical protein OKC_05284 [Enterococcus faecium EnGen0044]
MKRYLFILQKITINQLEVREGSETFKFLTSIFFITLRFLAIHLTELGRSRPSSIGG